MKQNIIKFSDERNKRFSIKTEIFVEDGVKKVYKYPIFDEGIAHICRIDEMKSQLDAHYDAIKPCKCYLHENCIEFEYVQGEALEHRYLNVAASKDRIRFEELLDYHLELISGNPDNACTFTDSDAFSEWFGSGSAYEGKAGFKFSNFDAIPSNIIIREGKPLFIDYEWVMDFVMPRDLVIYNCVHVLYLDNPWIDKFYPFEKALKYLGVEISLDDLQTSYAHFFEYIISDENGASYAKDKFSCLKPFETIEDIRNAWSESVDYWKQAIEANKNLTNELNDAMSSREEYKHNYELIVNSRSWKLVAGIKNIGKKKQGSI